MGDVKWTPDEFARILSLPPEHPERRAAQADPAFDGWVRMQVAFETAANAPLSEAELAGPRAELSGRLERALGAPLAGAGTRVGEAPARLHRGESLFDRLAGWIGAPAGRAVLAFGVVAIVAASGWWITSRRPESQMVRGTGQPGELVLAAPALSNGKLALSWNTVPEADGYRVVFYNAELAQVAQVDSLREPRREFEAGALPAGLIGGSRVQVEIVALVHGDPISRSRLRMVTLP